MYALGRLVSGLLEQALAVQARPKVDPRWERLICDHGWTLTTRTPCGRARRAILRRTRLRVSAVAGRVWPSAYRHSCAVVRRAVGPNVAAATSASSTEVRCATLSSV